MHRRTFVKSTAVWMGWPVLVNAVERGRFQAAAEVLEAAVGSGQVRTASICVHQGSDGITQAFGVGARSDDPYLLGSITKPICMTALMTLYDRGLLRLDDPAQKHLPEFTGNDRERVTIRQLLTHTSGLPDQLPENAELRMSHAPLDRFVAAALDTPLLFSPGTKYSYSSMGILLAAEIAQRLSGQTIQDLTAETVFQPLGMERSAIGLGRFRLEELPQSQTEFGAPESGAGDPQAKEWDWNSRYWRSLGAPWGTAHCSAPDVARFLSEFLHAEGKAVTPETARLMRRNHNGEGLTPRGLGFALGHALAGEHVSADTFGHTGSTGTIAWADPASDTVCVILTTLPGRAVEPHPRQVASDRVAETR
ncbi:MAG: beta-lactamase family protein [Planctomycetaceae bacterium]|nr:beta-lactamase family protein [Planctomycetaceae bacterium]